MWFLPLAGAAVGAAANIASNWSAYQSGAISGWDLATSAAFGAGTGALAAWPTGIIGGALAGGAAAFANNVYNQSLTNKYGTINFSTAGKAGVGGAAVGAAAGLLGRLGEGIATLDPVLGEPLPGTYAAQGAQPNFFDYAAHGGILGNAAGTVVGSQIGN